MADRPIIFSAPMVRAILAGTKTQTRRAIKAQPNAVHDGEPYWFIGGYRVWGYRPATAVPLRAGGNPMPCPYGQRGDRLWVRETHMDLGACYIYRAEADAERERALVAPGQRWRPAIHMPRSASRITLELTAVRVERLQDISAADAVAEWVHLQPRLVGYSKEAGCRWAPEDPCYAYCNLWEQINGPGSWGANPWVWVLAFGRLEAP